MTSANPIGSPGWPDVALSMLSAAITLIQLLNLRSNGL